MIQRTAAASLRQSCLAGSRGARDNIFMMQAADAQNPPDDVAVLLAHCATQDGLAFRRLYEQHGSTLYGVALRITRQPALASDAVHDALLQVWRNAARYDPARGSGRAWLLSLVRYRAMDAVRRNGREVTTDTVPEQEDTDPDPLARLLATQEGNGLHRCLQEVPPERRRLVVLAFVDGLTHAEVSARVGQPLGTVKSSIRRALSALRLCLTKDPA